MDPGTASTPPSESPTGADGRRRLAFFAVCLGNCIVMLDTTIVNLALPHIQDSLGGSLTGLVWVANGYTLAVAALILNGGALADRLGNDRAYRWGALGFALTSLACGLAPNLPLLIICRVLQGACGALLLPSLLGLIPHLFIEASQRARAVSIWATTGAVALAAGPLMAGVLIDGLHWRAIFYINIPICVGVYLIVRRTIADAPRRPSASLDLPGQILAICGLAALSFVLVEGPSFGWGSPISLTATAAGLLAIAAFVVMEQRSAAPLLPLGLFSNRVFTTAVVNGLLFQFVYFGALFIFPLYLQTAGGQERTALTAGLMVLPLAVCTALTPILITNRIVDRFGLRRPVFVGAAFGIPGCLLVLLSDPSSPYWILGVAMGLQGLWSGLTLPPTVSLVVTNTPHGFAGTGSGVLNAARQLGGALGVAVLGTLAGTASSITAGLHLGMIVAACGIALITMLLRVQTTG
jgi:DHA2 family methylenomycin A resistance protein-like MFS transporter